MKRRNFLLIVPSGLIRFSRRSKPWTNANPSALFHAAQFSKISWFWSWHTGAVCSYPWCSRPSISFGNYGFKSLSQEKHHGLLHSPISYFNRLFLLLQDLYTFSINPLNLIPCRGIDRQGYPGTSSPAFRRHQNKQSLFPLRITLISCTTNSSSIVIDTTAFILPSFSTLRPLTSVICICIPFLVSP